MMRIGKLSFALQVASLTMVVAGVIYAAVTTIPNSNLIPSTTYYTDSIGGGLGNVVTFSDGSTRNDDSSTVAINLGFTLAFFGQNYTQFFINNNGNISFGNGISSYTPSGPQGATQPIISPYFADVDTRNAASGLVYLRQDIPNQIIVTWDQTGYYSSHADKLASIQLVLRGPNYQVPSGQGQVGFFYKNVQWETGDASGGSNGFGGTPAAVGFGDGSSNGSVLQGSILPGISSTVSNTHIWFNIVGGVPTVTGGPSATPAPSSLLLLSLGGIGVAISQFLRTREKQAE